jgi:hypothetical protein
VLPVFFIVLASAALVAALSALFASLRASLGGPTEDTEWAGAMPDRGALEDEKIALLRALKDLEYEHEVGKIDDDDYARLERAYRARAKEVIAELDRDLAPYLSRAEALAGGAVEPPRGEKKKDKKKAKAEKKSESKSESESKRASESESASESSASPSDSPSPSPSPADDAPTRPVCPKCETPNDADAAFCKKCATPLAAKEATP